MNLNDKCNLKIVYCKLDMKNIINLSLITICAIITALSAVRDELIVFSIFLALAFYSGLYLLKEQKNFKYAELSIYLSYLFFVLLIALDFFLPASFAGLALIIYFYDRWAQLWILFSCIFIPLLPNFNVFAFSLTLLNCGFAIVLKNLTVLYSELNQKFFSTLDQNTLTTRTLEQHNKHLLEQREIIKENSILEERNRIAREIHDNVGHKLTSAIVQTGALEITVNQDLKPEIENLRNTLGDAMQQIRSSVHNLHQESISIENSLHQLCFHYHFCPIELKVKIQLEPENNIHRTIMAIAREALANTAKHSNATLITLALNQVANYYHLLIVDNGYTDQNQVKANKSGEGIGLMNIEERALLLGGSVTVSQENGFRIFVRLPVINNIPEEEET